LLRDLASESAVDGRTAGVATRMIRPNRVAAASF
jgi:hypothetical protein